MSTNNLITINMGVVHSEAYVHYGDLRITHMWEGSDVNGDKNNNEGEEEGILFGAQIRVYRRKKVERVWKGDMIQWGEDDMRYFLKRWVFRLQKKVRSNWRGKKKKISLPSGKRAGMESSSVYVGWWTDCREERAELLLKKVDDFRRDVSSLKSRRVCNQGVLCACFCVYSPKYDSITPPKYRPPPCSYVSLHLMALTWHETHSCRGVPMAERHISDQ